MFDMVFIMVAMTLVFQVLGLGRYKIFLIFAVGGYISLITSFTDHTAMIIVFFGLIVFNLWYLYDSWANQ